MSITPGTDNAPDPAPLLTSERQHEAMLLLHKWLLSEHPPAVATAIFLGLAQP